MVDRDPWGDSKRDLDHWDLAPFEGADGWIVTRFSVRERWLSSSRRRQQPLDDRRCLRRRASIVDPMPPGQHPTVVGREREGDAVGGDDLQLRHRRPPPQLKHLDVRIYHHPLRLEVRLNA